ncbi:MAG: DUF6427 family protein [Flaviramulus sp.]|nr:DUF6427 family protein [Flaviramulus sp.]
MIASFFNKSKPINFVIVFFITLLSFSIANFNLVNDAITFLLIVKQTVLLFIVLTSILLLNFIVSKNSLTKKNNYEMLLFSLFLLMITQTTADSYILISNFLVLLGLRRLLSLRSQKDIKKKLFDAAFWIALASLFYFWAILFFLLILISLVLYVDNNIRHWIIPFLGISTVFIICVSTSIIMNNTYFNTLNISTQISYDFSSYNSIKYLISITLLLSFGTWASIFYLNNIKKKKKASRASFKIIIIAAIVAFFIVILAPNKKGSEFLFLFAPLAIIITNYIEIIQEKWFKDVFLGALFVAPFILLLL